MAFSYRKQGIDDDRIKATNQSLTPEQAWEKIRIYCTYQERCHQEVKDKLYGFGLHRQDVETTLSRLIEENYLNEERFAIQYAGGHFRIKKWGRVKIKSALKQKGISEYCIKKALKEIDGKEYDACLGKLASAKWATLKGQHYLTRQAKCRDYLLQKGFESELVMVMVRKLAKGDE